MALKETLVDTSVYSLLAEKVRVGSINTLTAIFKLSVALQMLQIETHTLQCHL